MKPPQPQFVRRMIVTPKRAPVLDNPEEPHMANFCLAVFLALPTWIVLGVVVWYFFFRG